ncbi:MAG TPA: GNAT family N-acetyltransferase [Humibacillus xanthopallidus]|nr:GNAT family N-acetyltransferase [Humibacillus xanthopallidus]
MPVTLETPTVTVLDEAVEALSSWQREGGPVQLHPGDLGWNSTAGVAEMVRHVRVWRRDGEICAVGLLDSPKLVRLGIAPVVGDDEPFATSLLADLSDPMSGVLPSGCVCVEARAGSALRRLLTAHGWLDDEPWTPLRRDLSEAVEDCGLRIEVVDPARVADGHQGLLMDRVAVHRAAFERSSLTTGRWHAMASASPYRRARCLVGYDADDTPVAAVTVWSSGVGRPGLLEPLGVHHDHRGKGHGRAISLAAAAALRELRASSATVCTPSSNVGAVAAYASAGYRELTAVRDFRRPAH